MCGRFACTLDPVSLVVACTFARGKGGKGNRKEITKKEIKKKEIKREEKEKEVKEEDPAEFGEEDDSFLLGATIPAVDPFTPKQHTSFLYSPFKLEPVKEEVAAFEEEDEGFLLEASMTVEESLANVEEEEEEEEEERSEVVPVWRDAPCGGQYRPSTNTPPSSYTPVLVWRGEVQVEPMLWGMVPPWHRGAAPTSHGLSTSNARVEGVQESKLYSGCLRSRRCVVVCDGYYEWQKVEGGKQPFFVYRRQEEGGPGIERMREFTSPGPGPWRGPRHLYMAGLYNSWEGEAATVHSYSLLTTEAAPPLAWLHHRMPCILEESSILPWLTAASPAAALALLGTPAEPAVAWHPVTREVGNVRNQGEGLVDRVEPGQVTSKAAVSKGSKSIMDMWLKKGSKEVPGDGENKEPPSKRRKS